MASFASVLWLFTLFFAVAGRGMPFEVWLMLIGGLGCWLMSRWFFGLITRAPTALRMDKDGISGFLTAPLSWDEVAAIKSIENRKQGPTLGFELNDPIGVRNRQTPVQRLTSHLNGRAQEAHVLIRVDMLQDADLDHLTDAARKFHAQATGL